MNNFNYLENIIQNNKRNKQMNNETKTVRSGGIGFCGLLTIVFITLKLAGIGPVANWSWLWVLSPLWISFTIGLALVILCMIIYVLLDR